jgi:hypothetical protein
MTRTTDGQGWVSLPIRGFCYECCGMAERLVYETHHESGVGLCRTCWNELTGSGEPNHRNDLDDEEYPSDDTNDVR